MSSSTEKIWQVMPEVEDEFAKKFPDLDRVVLQLLYNRGISGAEKIEEFLNPDFGRYSHDPFLFRDMEQAIELAIKHIKARNKITVFGDYDADGVTASALLCEVLRTLKAEVDIYIPDRVSEGYGMNVGAIDEVAAGGTKLIITVDNGIRNKKEIDHALSLGLDVILTDHHIPPDKEENYPAGTVINPIVESEIYPFKYLAGVGVAFKFAQALVSRSKLSETDKEKLIAGVLDLVAIGTVADMVRLKGENRLLVERGLKALDRTGRIGLVELIKVAQITNGKALDSWNISFQIAPRLNAAGRMDHANTAFELLITKDKEEAEALARRLNSRNQDRQQETEEIFSEIDSRINPDDPGFIIASVYDGAEERTWNEGLIGLVAGKICEKYYRPALTITKTKTGYKGSGRSVPEFNLIEAIEECSPVLEKYGGHPAACGFSLASGNLEKFISLITDLAAKKLITADLRPKIKIDAALDFSAVNEELADKIKKFEPYGQGNAQPKFMSRAVRIVDIRNMGIDGQHIKLRLKSENSLPVNAIGFGQAERWRDLRLGDEIDIVYYVEMNEFNGRREAQIKIVDIKSHNA
ncbi:MAG: single-stranded-DNA-specific exonuclease RecJ [Candidatus Falkowbacteria bacterium]